MSNLPEFSDPSYIRLTNPFELPLHFLGLELIVYLCFGFTVWHAWSRHRAGDSYHLFQWVALFIYGLIMELVSFNYFQNYEHATFTIQFYHGKLPLYVTCIYLVFHYIGIKVVERLRLPWYKEGLVAGLAIMLLDVPFDTLGVDAGWWVWVDNSATAPHPKFVEAIETRWFGVPVTSYYWYLMYGALLAIFTRAAYRKVQNWRLATRMVTAPLVSVSVVIVGAIAFELFFWTPRAFGLSDDLIVATYLAGVLLLTLTVGAPEAKPAPRWLVLTTVLFHGFHLTLLTSLWLTDQLPRAAGKLGLLTSAAIVSVLMVTLLPLKRYWSTPSQPRSSEEGELKRATTWGR